MDVAIVNYNTHEQLRACLMTIPACEAGAVLVVNNASTDGSVEMLRAEYPWVRLIINQANRGYGAALNQAVASCAGEYVLLLNSDTCLAPGALAALSDYLDEHPRVALLGPRLHNLDGTLQASCYPFPTPLHLFLEESTLGRL